MGISKEVEKQGRRTVLTGLLSLHAVSCWEVHPSWECWQSEHLLQGDARDYCPRWGQWQSQPSLHLLLPHSRMHPSAVTNIQTHNLTLSSLQWDINLEQLCINVCKTAPQDKRNQLSAAKLGLWGGRDQPCKTTPIYRGETGNVDSSKITEAPSLVYGNIKKRQKCHSPACFISPQTSSAG